MFMKDAIAVYGFDCRIRKLSPKTIDCYTKQLRYFQEYLEQNHAVTHLEEVKKDHIKSFLAMMDSKNRKPQYINDLLKVFKTFFAYAVREGHIHINPTAGIKNVKQPKVKIITFSELEIRRMLNYYHGRDYLSTRNRTMIALFFDTGMRLNEVMTLCPEQIRDDHILVHGKGNKERMVPVSPYLAKALMQFQVVRGGYFADKLAQKFVFLSYRGRKMTQESITKVLKEAARAVGVNPPIRVSPHTCRHTFAHLQLKNGLDLYSLSRLLGHENIAITQRYLEGIRDDQVIKLAQRSGVLSNLCLLFGEQSKLSTGGKRGFCMYFSDAITECCFD